MGTRKMCNSDIRTMFNQLILLIYMHVWLWWSKSSNGFFYRMLTRVLLEWTVLIDVTKHAQALTMYMDCVTADVVQGGRENTAMKVSLFLFSDCECFVICHWWKVEVCQHMGLLHILGFLFIVCVWWLI